MPQDPEEYHAMQDDEEEPITHSRPTSGPRIPDPYATEDFSVLLPVFITIGAFIPILFCLCKL